MALETKHTEKFCLLQMLLVLKEVQSLEQAILTIRAIMEPEDVKLVEKELMDFINAKNK